MTSAEQNPPKPPTRVHVKWESEHRFDARTPGGAAARFDGSGKAGQSPVEMLLSALASCASIDVVDILAKRRTPVASLEVEVTGDRVDTIPRRFKHITLAFHITGDGIERSQAERAISLAVTKYCSVRDSLREDIGVDWTLDLNAAPAAGTDTSK